MCVDVDNYKIVNVYKPPPTRMQASDLPAFPHPCLYAGDFNCHHVDWGYDNSDPDGECLAGWASANNFTLLYSPKEAASFHSGRWKTDTNPDLAFASVDLDNRLPDRRILGKFPKSQHRPSLISPPKLAHSKPSKPVKRWNFRKANWDHYSNLTNKLAKSIPPSESQNIDQVYQCSCKVISTAAKKCIPRAVFIDLTAAYDTVWHRGLTWKLLRLLPDKHMVRMIMELIRNRSFTLTTGDSKPSRLRRLRNGVPQGSVLAPLLFNIYTYDIPCITSKKFAYADDLAIFHTSGE